LKKRDRAFKLPADLRFPDPAMATEPKRPNDGDNIVSLREARARQAAAQARANRKAPADAGEKKMPVLLIFLGLLAIVVAVKVLVG
jgi:hypothetical protein